MARSRANSERAGEALLELATFYEDFLVREDGAGHVVFAPSYSPENAPAGWAPAAVNATMDMRVDSVPGLEQTCPSRIELHCIDLLPAVPAFLPAGRLRGARTLAGVRVVSLRWDTATGEAEAVLESARECTVEISCWGSAARRRVTLPAGTPARLRWGSNREVGDGDTR